MTHLPLAALAFAALTLSLPAQADSLVTATSSAGSSASSAGSASLRGSSDSISGLAGGGDGDKTALIPAGGYRVDGVAAVDAQGRTLRLALVPQDDAAPAFELDVPAQAFGAQRPAAGEVIQVQRRDYGLQFARGAQNEPFFLVLADATQRELNTRPL
ncbi:MAG: hypothetical protein Q4F13_09000 [Pseudomonadota bacterium]|nr:hypothetical protein [Pseudomonadota bacterium]